MIFATLGSSFHDNNVLNVERNSSIDPTPPTATRVASLTYIERIQLETAHPKEKEARSATFSDLAIASIRSSSAKILIFFILEDKDK